MPVAKKYIVKLAGRVDLGKSMRTDLKVTLQNGKADLDEDDVKAIFKDIQSDARKKGYDVQMMIRGLNIQHFFTLKGFSDDNPIDNMDEYYSADVKNPAKFSKFSQLQVSVIKSKNKK
jgi:hypothetical protein